MCIKKDRMFPIIRRLKEMYHTERMLESYERGKRVRSLGVNVLNPFSWYMLIRRLI